MAVTGSLGRISHDLQVTNKGTIKLTASDAEIVQRVKVALWHYDAEYFLNTLVGVPWHEQILGRKQYAGTISSILRRAILNVEGVVRLEAFSMLFDTVHRILTVSATITVTSGSTYPVTVTQQVE